MKIEKVSLWIGEFDNGEVREDYFKICYTENGDRIPSKFEENFSLEYDSDESYDEDFSELIPFEENEDDIEILLEGCSYDNQIIPKFIELIKNDSKYKGNTVFLAYDFEYSGIKKFDEGEGYSVKFVGAVSYDEDEDDDM